MAISVVGKNYTQISSCDLASSGGTWSTMSPAADSGAYKEGAASLSFICKSLGNNDIVFTPTGAVNLLNKHLRFWFISTHGKLLETYANGGLQVGVTGGGNTGWWKVLGRSGDYAYPGGWINCVIDTSKACDSGTKPTDMTAITVITFRVVLTGTGKNAANTWIDNLCVCDGLVAYGDYDSTPLTLNVVAAAGTFSRGSGSFVTDGFRVGMRIVTSGFTNGGNNTTKVILTVATLVITVTDITGLVNESGGGDERIRGFFDLNDIFTADDATTLGIGIIRQIGGQYFVVGSFEIGLASGSAETKFQAKSSVLVFENRRVNDVLYAINVVDNGTGTTMFLLGSKSGSSGIEGCMIRTQSSAQTCKFTLDGKTDTDVDYFNLYGTTFYDAGVISFPPNSANVEVLNCNFEAGSNVIVNTAVVKNCNFVSSDTAAVKMSSASHHVTDCNFVGCSRGVLIDTYVASYPFDNLKFSGCTYDVHNTSGSAIEVGKSNGSNPTTYDPAGNVVTFTGSIILTMTVKTEGGAVIAGALAYIDNNDVTPFIMNTTTNESGVATTSYTGSPVTNARWRVRKYGYKAYAMLLSIAGDNISLPVTLVADPQQT